MTTLNPASALIILGLLLMALEAFVPSFGAAAVIGAVAFGLGALSMLAVGALPAFIFTWPFVEGFTVFALILVGFVIALALKILDR